MNEIVNWISTWFSSHCDGDWEHENIIKIETLSNPGWTITIDVNYTELDEIDIKLEKYRASDDDWYSFEIKKNTFRAGGDPSKLYFLLNKFKELVEANAEKNNQ